MEIPSEEFDRIKILLNEDKPLCKELKKGAMRSASAKNLTSYIKIPGFRQNTPAHHKPAFDKAYGEIKKGSHKPVFWDIYKFSVAEYIGNNLNKLLSEIDAPPIISSNDLFKLISRYCFTYNVEKKDVLKLYDTFPIDRFSNIDEIIELCGEPDQLIEIENNLSQMESKLKGIIESQKIELVEHFQKEIIKANDLNNFDDYFSKTSWHSKIETLIIQIDRLDEEFQEHNKKVDSKVNIVEFKRLKNELKLLEKNINNNSHQIKNENKNIREAENNISNISKNYLKSIKEFETDIDKSINDKLLKFKDSIVNQCRELISLNIQGLGSTDENNKDYLSPLLGKPKFLDLPKGQIKTESNFISSFHGKLQEIMPGVTYTDTCIYHIIFKSSPCLICSRPDIYKKWLSTLGWNDYSLSIAATPTWGSEEDWKLGAIHLFGNNKIIPKILFVFDYDIGLIEGYLLPTLRLWREGKFEPIFSKLVLIPSESNKTIDQFRLLEAANFLNNSILSSNPDFDLLDNWRKQEELDIYKSNIPTAGVDTSTFSSWINYCSVPTYTESFNTNDAGFNDLAQSNDIELSSANLGRYAKLKAELEKFFHHKSAHLIALNCTIYPWVSLKYGAEDAKLFSEQITSLSLD